MVQSFHMERIGERGVTNSYKLKKTVKYLSGSIEIIFGVVKLSKNHNTPYILEFFSKNYTPYIKERREYYLFMLSIVKNIWMFNTYALL